MANNRLFLVDKTTGDRLLLTSTQGVGWYFFHEDSEVAQWMTEHDKKACIGNCVGEDTNLRLEVE